MTRLSGPRRMLREYRYLSVTLLSEVYEQATGSPPPGPDQRRTWSWPRGRDWGIWIDRPPFSRAELLHVTEQHLRGQWRPLAVAGPGSYLHVPSASLRLRALPAASIAGTAAWLHGTADDPEAGRTLIALTGPIEDCPDLGRYGAKAPGPGIGSRAGAASARPRARTEPPRRRRRPGIRVRAASRQASPATHDRTVHPVDARGSPSPGPGTAAGGRALRHNRHRHTTVGPPLDAASPMSQVAPHSRTLIRRPVAEASTVRVLRGSKLAPTACQPRCSTGLGRRVWAGSGPLPPRKANGPRRRGSLSGFSCAARQSQEGGRQKPSQLSRSRPRNQGAGIRHGLGLANLGGPDPHDRHKPVNLCAGGGQGLVVLTDLRGSPFLRHMPRQVKSSASAPLRGADPAGSAPNDYVATRPPLNQGPGSPRSNGQKHPHQVTAKPVRRRQAQQGQRHPRPGGGAC